MVEAPVMRKIVGDAGDPGAGGGDPLNPAGGGGGGGGVFRLPTCTRADQGNCCYDDIKFRGIPKCSWRQLGPGASVPISSVFIGRSMPEKARLPVQTQLISATPTRFETLDECKASPIGFALAAPGMEERTLVSGISHFYIKADGTWDYGGGGATVGLVVGQNNAPGFTRDAGEAPAPTYKLHDGLCMPLAKPENKYYVEFTDFFDFKIDGVEYETHFDRYPNGDVTGYYVVIGKNF